MVSDVAGRTADIRLAPRWAVVVVCALALVLLATGAVLSAGSTGLERAVALGYLVLGVLATVVAALAFAPRRDREPARAADGSVTFAAPALQVGCLLLGWATVWVLAALVVARVATGGLDAVESPGAALVLVVATVASLPDVVRLLGGRLHRWRLTVGPDGIDYRGYRTAVTLPWGKVRDAHLQASRLLRWGSVPPRMRPAEDGPRGYGVLLDRSGTAPDVLVPQAFLRTPAARVLAEIERARP